MKRWLFLTLFFIVFSCTEDEEPIQQLPCDQYTFNLNDGDLFKMLFIEPDSWIVSSVRDSLVLTGCINTGASFSLPGLPDPILIHRISKDTLITDLVEKREILSENSDTLRFRDNPTLVLGLVKMK